MANGNMEHRNLVWKTTLGSHDTNVTTEEARNASKGRICMDPAHNAVISFGRGRTVHAIVTLARQSHMLVSGGGAAPPAPRQPCNQAAQFRDADGKKPRRFLPKRTAAALVKVDPASPARARNVNSGAGTRTGPAASSWAVVGAP